ncbi:MAG TPA: flagellar motor protein MotB [Terracidiphilus sp.]|jgi:chemotaxis protein MotB|nr:flagellar motor protein MotB [Terracidiphilus sp.]
MSTHLHKGNASHERWLVSYADFITLMFAFFVVLYASATANEKKQAQISDSINAAFRALGVFPSAARKPAPAASLTGTDKPALPVNIVMGEDVLAPARVQDDLERIRRELTQMLSNQVAGHTVSIQMGRDGLVISLREAGFFASGSAAPKPETLSTLRQIATSLAGSPYEIRIEGHTDNVPIHTAEFDSNWELSAARATRIARVFLDQQLIAPERISAAGYAEFHPVASNDTAEGRAQNRRVDLVVLPRTKVNFAAPRPVSTASWHKITDGD